jgi:hypothetical protein
VNRTSQKERHVRIMGKIELDNELRINGQTPWQIQLNAWQSMYPACVITHRTVQHTRIFRVFFILAANNVKYGWKFWHG